MAKKKYIYTVFVDFSINENFYVRADSVKEAKAKALAQYKRKFLKDKNFEVAIEDKSYNI
ncbi:MAG: hypothetical protein IKR72_02855 [Bacteroidales bacterium]|nr:hypothetical protein [Bacteroidales bacterium]